MTDAPVSKPARADARRNRDGLIVSARALFAADDGAVSLERVARGAGVGIGTLYRHFATREALVEAVYESELAEVTSPGQVVSGRPAAEALRAWLDRYAVFVHNKQGMLETLRAGWASGEIATPTTRDRITAVIAGFLEAGAEDGSLRGDVLPDDVTAALLGVFLSVGSTGSPEQAGRLLDLLVAGLRHV